MEDTHINAETENNDITHNENGEGQKELVSMGEQQNSDYNPEPAEDSSVHPENTTLRVFTIKPNTKKTTAHIENTLDESVVLCNDSENAVPNGQDETGQFDKGPHKNSSQGPKWLVYSIFLMIGFFIGASLILVSTKLNDTDRLDTVSIPETTVQYEVIYRDNGDISDIVESSMDSIVSITSTIYYQQFNFFAGIQSYEIPSSGSGIIIEKSNNLLYIATNNHVVDGSNELTVEFSDGSSVPASVNGTSSDSDVAVITVKLSDIPKETLSTIKVASLHTADDLKVGNQVIAIGNALGYGQSVTVGYISALGRTIWSENKEVSGLIQTDAAINPGNSGGALINMNGEVIGINVAKYSSTEVEGMGYSIPISKIKDLIDVLSKEKIDESDQGCLGIQCTTIDNQMSTLYDMPQGVFVYKILNTQLFENGLFEKDIITSIDGHTILTAENLTELFKYYRKGTEVQLSVKHLENGSYVDKEISVMLIGKNDIKKAD